MADILQDRDIVQDMAPSVAAEALRVLKDAEPDFGSGGLLGMSDVFRYQKWNAATMVLSARLSAGSDAAMLTRNLPRPAEADPRKLMALLHSEALSAVARTAFDINTRERIRASIDTYAKEHSDVSDIQEMAVLAKSRLGLRP